MTGTAELPRCWGTLCSEALVPCSDGFGTETEERGTRKGHRLESRRSGRCGSAGREGAGPSGKRHSKAGFPVHRKALHTGDCSSPEVAQLSPDLTCFPKQEVTEF